MKLKIILGVVFWLACAVFNYGAYLAVCQEHARGIGGDSFAIEMCRKHAGFAAAYGLIFGPIATVNSPFLTGFYQYGFQFRCRTAPFFGSDPIHKD